MDRSICERCGRERCVMFFRHERNGEKGYVHIYNPDEYTPFNTVWTTEVYTADSVVMKQQGCLICSRAMYENWTDQFPWEYDRFLPSRQCGCYAEQLVASLNSKD